MRIKRIKEKADIFTSAFSNNTQSSERTPLDAWLAFLSVDDPEWIEKLIQQYPEFVPLYEAVYAICKNVERVMGIFSEELRIMDRNTVQLMTVEMQDEIDGMKELLGQKDKQLSQKDEALRRKEELLLQKEEKIKQLEKRLEELSLT